MANKRKVIQSGIEQQDAYYQQKNKEEFAEIEKRKNDPYRPNLLKRMGSIILDALCIFGVIAGLFLLSYYTIFPKLGYQQIMHDVHERYVASGLYVIENDNIISAINRYDEDKTPKSNYDGYITYYYQNDERAIAANKFNLYCSSKLSSNLFETVDDRVVEKSSSKMEDLKKFYENEYKNAVSFQEKDPYIINGGNKTLLISVGTMMVCSVISTSIFYLVIPLSLKRRVTIGQYICKFSLSNMEDKVIASRKKVVIRYFVILVFDYLLSISIYILFPSFIGLPLFVTAAMIAFSKNNTALHDFFSQSKVQNMIPIDHFEALKVLKEQAKNNQIG